MTAPSFVDLVREYFPGVTDEQAMDILWNYTGFPGFWDGDPARVCREQLAHLKEVGPAAVDAEFEAILEMST